jgi:hypothetical protein
MAQREALERQIDQTKKQERGDAIEKVRALMAEYGLTVADLGNRSSGHQGEENQVQRQQGRRQVSQCLDRRIVERPGAAAALVEGGAGERTQAERLRGVNRSRPAPSAPRRSPRGGENGRGRIAQPRRCAPTVRLDAMIPPAFVHELLSRVDIVEIVGRSVELKRAGSTWKGLCPFHGEKSPSFTVTPSRQTYHCFGCGVHGNAGRLS